MLYHICCTFWDPEKVPGVRVHPLHPPCVTGLPFGAWLEAEASSPQCSRAGPGPSCHHTVAPLNFSEMPQSPGGAVASRAEGGREGQLLCWAWWSVHNLFRSHWGSQLPVWGTKPSQKLLYGGFPSSPSLWPSGEDTGQGPRSSSSHGASKAQRGKEGCLRPARCERWYRTWDSKTLL